MMVVVLIVGIMAMMRSVSIIVVMACEVVAGGVDVDDVGDGDYDVDVDDVYCVCEGDYDDVVGDCGDVDDRQSDTVIVAIMVMIALSHQR